MKASVKTVLVLVSTLSLVNLAQAQSGPSNRLERLNRARKGLNQSAGGKNTASTKQVSSSKAVSAGSKENSGNK